MSDLRSSNLIRSQLPEFIRDEYPKFISFLEAYYEFLDEKQGTENNDLNNKAKSLRNLADVNQSLDDFENNFYEKFAALLPRDAEVRKDILFKNLNRLYLSKGNIESYKFLFKLLFNEELEIIIESNHLDNEDPTLNEEQFGNLIMSVVTQLHIEEMLNEGLLQANFDAEEGENLYTLTKKGKKAAEKL